MSFSSNHWPFDGSSFNFSSVCPSSLAAFRISQAHYSSQTLESQPGLRRPFSISPATHESTQSKLPIPTATTLCLVFIFISSTTLAKLHPVETSLDGCSIATAAAVDSVGFFACRIEGRCRLSTTFCCSTITTTFTSQLCFYSAVQLRLHSKPLLLLTASVAPRTRSATPYCQRNSGIPICDYLIRPTLCRSIIHQPRRRPFH